MRYRIVYEKAQRNYSAYSPDLLGCVATGDTLDPAELAEGPLFPELGEPQPTRSTPGVRSSARQRRITLRGQIGDLAR